MAKYVTDFFIYRWRYVIGYGVLGLMLIEIVVIAALYIPGGLSPQEISSTVTSNALSFGTSDPSSIINLPFYLLQHISFSILGVTTLSIKLPALLFGIASIAGMVILLRTWFRENVAILTTILIVTTSQFLFFTQSGTPGIMYVFWSTWILVAATMLSRGATWSAVWKIVLFGLVSLSLYSPLSIYVLVALISAVIFHPHLRYIVRKLSLRKMVLASFCALVLVAPLIQAIVMRPILGLQLLGIPENMPNIVHNSSILLTQYIDFASPSSAFLMTPVYGLASMLLILLGVYRLVTTKYTARSYIISIWIILLIPVLVINPMYVSVTFVPVMLLMAMGITILFSRWYRLFPLNPYARIAGLIPLSVLVISMVFSGIDRYAYGYHYDPETANNFSRDLRTLDKKIISQPHGSIVIVASKDEVPFYQAVASHRTNIYVRQSSTEFPIAATVIVTHTARSETNFGTPSEIITSTRSEDSDRFYIYKSPTK
jgi:uncharacterized membrane protein